MLPRKQSEENSREARLRRICDKINNSAFGGDEHNAVTWLGSSEAIPIERFPSGCDDLDRILGGGWPKGRFVEVFGTESSGKTTIVLHALASHQKVYPDQDVAFVDTEHAFDPIYASQLGVNTKYLIVNQPESGEQALNVLSMLIREGVGCAVVDSVAALTTKAELDGDLGNIHVGQQARLMSQALRRLVAEAGQSHSTVFWTNQVRDKIGVMWGDKTTTPAGRALRHYASIRLHLAAIGKVKEGDEVVSSRIRAECKKNKVAAPFRTCEFNITFGRGVDVIASLLDLAITMGVIEKRGAFFTFRGERFPLKGKVALLDKIRAESDLRDAIKADLEVKKQSGATPVQTGESDEAKDDESSEVSETSV